MKLDRAKRALRRARCGIGRIRRVRTRRASRGRVISQRPAPGQIRRRGFPVNLVLGRRR